MNRADAMRHSNRAKAGRGASIRMGPERRRRSQVSELLEPLEARIVLKADTVSVIPGMITFTGSKTTIRIRCRTGPRRRPRTRSTRGTAT